MKNLFKWALVLPLIASITLVSCNKDDDDPMTPKKKSPVADKEMIFEGTASGANLDVKVYADEALYVGYNRIYVMLYETGTNNVVTDAHIEFGTEMAMMMGHTHASPVESPSHIPTEDGVYQGAIVFIMPSEGNGTWKMMVDVHNHDNGEMGTVESEVSIVSPDEAKMYSFISDTDGSKVFVSLVEPMNPEVGENTFEVAVHYKETMMSFPYFEGLMIEIEPEMPTMGHGSPGNVNPTYTSMGHYAGVVNYTMTGLWRVHVTVKDENGDIMNDSNYFDMTF